MAKAHILNELLERLGMNISTFEKKIGIGSSTIHKAVQRDSDLKMDTIQKIVDTFPNVSKQWLQTGEGEMFTTTGAEQALLLPDEQKQQPTTTNNPNNMNEDYRLKYEKLLEKTNDQLSAALATVHSMATGIEANLNKAVKGNVAHQTLLSVNQSVIFEAIDELLHLEPGATAKNADNARRARLQKILKRDTADI